MSKTKTIEGEEYILKSAVDEIVRQRISKYSERAREAESRIDTIQSELDETKSRAGVSEKLTLQIDELKQQLEQSQTRYQRHTTISEFGITSPSVRDAVEIFHEREMTKLPKKDRVGLSEWLGTIKEDPTRAPEILRPHFMTKTEPQTTAQQTTAQQTTPPSSNAGVQAGGEQMSSDLLARAAEPRFFEQNRAAIREAWYNQHKPK